MEEKGHTYKYFGAARNLPEVKELFEKSEATEGKSKKKRTRYDYNGIGIEYYGANEEEDAELIKLESEAEKKIMNNSN